MFSDRVYGFYLTEFVELRKQKLLERKKINDLYFLITIDGLSINEGKPEEYYKYLGQVYGIRVFKT